MLGIRDKETLGNIRLRLERQYNFFSKVTVCSRQRAVNERFYLFNKNKFKYILNIFVSIRFLNLTKPLYFPLFINSNNKPNEAIDIKFKKQGYLNRKKRYL